MTTDRTPQQAGGPGPVGVFLVRAEADEDLSRALDTHLAVHRRGTSRRPALLQTWSPASVPAGDGREEAIRAQLDQAQIAVVFISRDLWSSERYGDLERAFELRKERGLRLVPIRARPFDLGDHDLADLQALPRKGGPLTSQPSLDQALTDIGREIVEMAQKIQAGTAAAQVGAPKQENVFSSVRAARLYTGSVPEVRSWSGLERVLRAGNRFQDVDAWTLRLGRIRRQVCKIVLPGDCGSGFLVGPDLVLTNYHVLEGVIAHPANAGSVAVLFDDAVAAAGQVAAAPRRCLLRAADWLVDHSPYSREDATGTGDPEKIRPDELDYALIRLAEPAGAEVLGAGPGGAPILRGWLEGRPFDFPQGSPLFVVQHPDGGPMKLALDTDAVVGLSKNGLRVTYRTNTEPGSSGSPCFTQDWELVALHHHGTKSRNQGIPIMKIVDRLKARGVALPPAP